MRSWWLTLQLIVSLNFIFGQIASANIRNCQMALIGPSVSSTSPKNSKLKNTLWPSIYYGAAFSAGLLMPVMTLAGGFSGSGGGGAVLTLKSARDLAKARRSYERGQSISLNIIKRGQLRTLERFEMEKTGTKPFAVSPTENWQMLLERAYENVRLISPILARRLEQVSAWMAFSKWENSNKIPLIEDALPLSELTNSDLYLQAALRLSNGNNEPSQGPARHKVEIKVLFNQNLFDQFDPLDQAMLVLHEQLYALGQAAGLNSSDEIRPLVILFFSDYSNDLRTRSQDGLFPIGLIPFFKNKLATKFGDYAIFFSAVEKIEGTVDRSADRHFNLFVDVILELREQMHKCHQEGFVQDVCAAKVLTDFASRSDLSPEKAFVFMNYFLLEKTLGLVNSEIIMNNKLSDDRYAKVLDYICGLMLQNSSTMVDEAIAMRSAINYCQ